MTHPHIYLTADKEKRLLNGHPWVFSNEIRMDQEARSLEKGSLVTLVTAKGKPVATAFFNPHSLIAARLLSRVPDAEVDRNFFVERLQKALAWRRNFFTENYFRLIHAEADGFPGVIIDLMGDVVVMQINTAGMERLLPEILHAIKTVIEPMAIVLRNDSASREMEGLAQQVLIAKGSINGPVHLKENGLEFMVDVLSGQKTGWFYDQRANRRLVMNMAKGKRVLDLFSYNGGFALAAAKGGASEVLAIDRSAGAVDLARMAAALNQQIDRCTFRKGDVVEECAAMQQANEKFDMVIADPPAYVKSKKDLHAGLRGYRKLFRHALQLVKPGGIFVAASCSHHVNQDSFHHVLAQALADNQQDARIINIAGADIDHPLHPMLPESNYLKAFTLQVG
ncbi:MAG: class I SAM-dependent rRNA methyltransferase [Alphaproteobacteria bacterium]